MKRRGLGENSLWALGGDGASKLAAFAVVLLSARLLSVGEFAVLATGLAAAGLLAALLDFGAGTLLVRDGTQGPSERGALFRGLLEARAPLALVVLVVAPFVGLLLGRPVTALAVTALGLLGAVALSVLALYRSCQDVRPEAIQKLCAAALSVAVTAVVCVVVPSADALLVALVVVALATLAPLVHLAPRVADFGGRVGRRNALRRAAPIGLLALATVAYYRSGTIALAALAGSNETAAFGVAASIAFGLLIVPNAITTALLPRLSAERDLPGVVDCTRRTLTWTLVVAVLLSAAAAVAVPVGLPFALGGEYADAGAPFALLCIGLPFIAASGVIGTALLSVGKLRPLGAQVAASLAVNLVVLAVLVPFLGAIGAALATVACETVGLLLLAYAAHRALPGLIAVHHPTIGRGVETSRAAT
jgi:O-antigen/teichoic acid export membrane protein